MLYKGEDILAKKKKKKQIHTSFPRFLRFAFILLIALIIIYSYYLGTEGVLLEKIKNSYLTVYHFVFNFVRKNPTIMIAIASYGLVFYLGYFIGKKRG